ncbi:Myotubularin-like phosphatase domain, variant 2 [Balamuthia mandrillaris]
MKRQGIELWEGREWKLSDVNQGYKLCECYPSLLVVPRDSEEEELRAVARVRRLARLPALTWKSQERLTCAEFARHDENATDHQQQPISKACLLRGADLNANTIEDTVFGKVAGNELDYEADERYLLKMLDLNPASPSLHIIDSSSALAMMPAEGLLPDSNAPNSLNSSATASALTAAINAAASNGAAGHGTAGEGGGGTELVKMTTNDESNTMGAAAAEGSIIIGGDKLNAMRGITIEAATKESLLKLKHLCTTSTPFFFSRKAAVNTKTKNEDRQVQHFRIRTRTRINRQRRPSRAADDDNANEDNDHAEVQNAGGDSRLAGLLDSKQAWQQGLRASGWLKQIRALFNLALEMMAHLLEDAQQDPPKPPETVLAQSMLGVDSTAQLVSLVQLCSDPYYRTFEGFAVLIEKDWESFGHSFGQKVTKRYDSEQMSSTFVQFVDCVWQLMNQFPCAFEFSETYLLFLLRSLYSRRFATFLYDNEKERYADRRKYKRGLPCIWKYSLSAGRQKAYGNPFFGQAGDDPSKPLIPRPSAVTLWQGYYLRWTCKEQVLAAIQKTERCQQTLTAELDLSFSSLPISPDRLQHLAHLTQLDLSGNHLTSFPIALTSLRRLKKLSLAYNAISILPTSILQAYARPDVESAQLEELDLGQNTIVSFPWCGWENLPCLTSLKLNNNKISGQLPPSISSLSCLRCLCLQNNNIELLPRSIVKLTSLTYLDLGKNKLGKLPGHLFRKLTNLKHLCLAKNNLTQLPRGLKFLKRLHTFDLSHNSGLCIDEGPEEKKTGTHPPYSAYLSKENNRTPALFELFELGCTLKELNLAGLRFGHLYSTMNKLHHKDPFRSSESMIIATKQGHATQIETFIDGLWSELKVLEVLNLRETGITMKHSFHRSQGNHKRSNVHQQHRHRHKGRKSKSNDNRLPQSDTAVLDDKREEDFPWGIFAIPTLQKLYLGNNHILELPDLVQNLPNLVLLDLCSTRLKHVSPRIGHLLKLSTLHLCHNKDLQELPSQMGFLVQLERLKLPNHKYFTFPPSDVVAMGKSSVISWLQQAFQGTQRCYRMKLMLVGQENVGKTSVLKCLSSSSHKYKLKKQQLAPSRTTIVSTTEEPSMVVTPATPAVAGANQISESHSVIATSAELAGHELKSGDGTSLQENALGPNTISTDGIDIAEWSISVPIQHKDGTAEKQGVVLSAWDFAGQELYYSTHQFFLSERSLYLLVWNLARPEEDSRVEYWLYSIAARAPEAAVIMVGTHLDSPICGEEQYTANVLKKLLAKYKSKFPSIQSIHFVSCANGKGLEELKADIADTVSKQRWIGEEMPNTYVELEKMVKNSHKRPPIAFWSEFLTMAGLCGIKDEMAVRVAASHLHNLGSLLYFGEDPRLSDIVIMNPQWLTEVMSSIITTKHNYGKKDGILQHSSLPFIWREPDYPASVHPFLLTLLEKFEVAFNMGAKTSQDLNQGFSLIPALLSAQSRPSESLLTQLWPPITSLMRSHRGHLIQDRTASLGLMGLRSLMLHAAGGSGSGGTLIHPHADIGGTYVLGGDKSKWAFLNALTAEALDQMEENEFSRYYLFQFVPEGFFSRLMVRLLAFDLTAKEYWKNGLLVTKGEEKVFMELMDNCFLSPSSSSGSTMGTSSGSLSPFIDLAMLQFPPDKNKEAIALHNATKILRLVVRTKLLGDNLHTLYSSIIEMVDSLISDWYKLRVSVYAPCIRCILNQAYFQDIYGQRSATATLRGDFSNVLAGVYMFRIETCKAMALEGKPFLYCPACFSKGWHHAQGEGGLVRLDKIAPDLALVQLQKFKVDYEKDLMIEELIGEGGYAYVYKATYKGEPVAVKRLKTKEESGMLGEEAENARLDAFTEFRREVWVMSGLDHPNIVPLRGFSLEPCCIVTEFMQHGSLYSYLHDEKSANLSWALRFKIAKDIAKGCAFLHGCSPPVLHRDLKSPNILVRCSISLLYLLHFLRMALE